MKKLNNSTKNYKVIGMYLLVVKGMKIREVETDVLVIGGGSAGCMAAIRARELGASVTVVSKATAGSSGPGVFAAGGLGYFPPDSDLDESVKMAIRWSDYTDDQEMVDIIVKKSYDLFKRTQEWGVKYLQKERGKLWTWHLPHRCLGVCWDGGGKAFMWALRAEAERRGAHIINRVMVTDLLTSDGRHPTKGSVIGAVGFDVRNGDFYVWKAKATVLASGDWNIQATYSDMDGSLTGDGKSMAFRAGAIMRNLEQGAFWPQRLSHNTKTTSIWFTPPDEKTDIPETGIFYSDKDGNNLLGSKYWKAKTEALHRGIFVNDIHDAIAHKGGAFDNFVKATPAGIIVNYRGVPVAMKSIEAAGYILPKELVPVAVTLSGTMTGGGIRRNKNCETSIPGLLAAGAVTERLYSGVPGLNGCTVEGWVAGENAAKYAQKASKTKPISKQVEELRASIYAPLSRKEGVKAGRIRANVQKIVEDALGPIRTEDWLKKAINEIEELKKDVPQVTAKDSHELMKANEIRNMVEFLELVGRAALMRTESRLAHRRKDFPQRDDKNWVKHICAQLAEGGEIKFWTEDIPTPILKPGE